MLNTENILFSDLVWSDPEDVDTWAMSPRGAGWLFGSKVTSEVCKLMTMLKIEQVTGSKSFPTKHYLISINALSLIIM